MRGMKFIDRCVLVGEVESALKTFPGEVNRALLLVARLTNDPIHVRAYLSQLIIDSNETDYKYDCGCYKDDSVLCEAHYLEYFREVE